MHVCISLCAYVCVCKCVHNVCVCVCEGVEVWSTCMSGTHMVCMYGKILTSILRIDVDMTSRTACD